MSLDGTVKIGVDLDDKNFKSALSRLGNTAKGALSVVGTSIAGISTALVGVGIASVGMASQFERSMAMTSTLFGDISVKTDLLNTNMLALSSTTGYTAKELGDSLYNALSAGIPVTKDMGQALEFMEKSSKLAIGAGADLGAVVDSQTSIMNAYKLETKDLDKIQKILIQTQNKGKTTVAELSQSLSNVTPVAAAMGIAFDQVGASLATMTAQGTPTAVATTQLKSLFAELGKSGTQANKGLAEATKGTMYAGKSFQQLAEEGVPLNAILDSMREYAEKSGKSLLDMFGSIEAGNAALSLSGENSETYASNLDAMSISADVVGEAFETMSNTFQFQSKKAVEGFKNLGIAMVIEQDGMLASLGKFTNDIVSQLQSAFDEGGTQGLINSVGGVFSTILIKIAENTPNFVQASVNVMQSFIRGVGESLPQISESAIGIISSLVEGVTSVLPEMVKIGMDMIVK
ncbi:MAG: phage tail tape measure protein, partial [Oscillospiraceae bacterium]